MFWVETSRQINKKKNFCKGFLYDSILPTLFVFFKIFTHKAIFVFYLPVFIAEGGKECLNESQEGISECFQTLYNSYSSTPLNHTFNKDSMNWLNQTVSNHSANWLNQTINNNTVNMLNETLNSLPPLVFEAEQCQ